MALRPKSSPSPSVRFSAVGRGRARATAIAGLIGATVLLLGCGESRHANQQRPSGSTRVSVTINEKEVIVQPKEIAQRSEPTQEIPQNQNHPEPPIKTGKPLNVTFVAANQTATDTQLKIRGAKEAESDTLFARSLLHRLGGRHSGGAAGPPDGGPLPRLLAERRPAALAANRRQSESARPRHLRCR